jgi:hypothetical protein
LIAALFQSKVEADSKRWIMLQKTGIFALCLMALPVASIAESWLCISLDAVAAEKEMFRGRASEFVDVTPENYVVTFNRETEGVSVKVVGGDVRFAGPECRIEVNNQNEPMAVCSSIKGYYFMATNREGSEGVFVSTRVVVDEGDPSFQTGMCEPL